MSTSNSPRSLRRKLEQAHRRADVVNAAAAVFAEKGFHDAQIAEIAKTAEVSLASIYSLFDGKDEIYREVIVTAARSIRESVQDRVEAIEDPTDRLLSLIDVLFECFEDNQHLLTIYAHGTHGLPWRARQVMGDQPMTIYHEFTAWVTRLATKAQETGALRNIEPEVFAVSLIGAVTGTVAHWIEINPQQPISQAGPAVRAIFARILRGESDKT